MGNALERPDSTTAADSAGQERAGPDHAGSEHENVEPEEGTLLDASEEAPFSWFDSARVRNTALLGIFVVAGAGALYAARVVFFPIVLAVFFNLLLSPVVRWLNRMGVPNPLGAAVVMAGALAMVCMIALQLIEPATQWISRMPETIQSIEDKLHFIKEPIQDISAAGERIASAAEMQQRRVTAVRLERPQMTGALLTVTGSVLGELLVSLVLLYFFLSSGDRFLSKCVEVMPTLRNKKKVVEIGRTVERSISIYLLSVGLINLILGSAIAAAMWLLGMPNPLLWGAMAAIVNFVPYVGSITGLTVISIAALTTFENPWYAVLVAGVYFTLDTLEGAVFTPLFIGLQFDLSPPVILMWLLLWGWLWGVPGVLMAVPLLTALKIVCEHVEGLTPVATFLGK